MLTAEFVLAYPREMPDNVLQDAAVPPEISAARGFANRFGILMHDELSGAKIDYANQLGSDYISWLEGSRFKQAHAVSDQPHPDRARRVHEMNFHDLNSTMLMNWALLAGDPTALATRGKLINFCQDDLSTTGSKYAISREQVSGITHDYRYFAADNTAWRGSFEGRANECDAGIVALEAMKRQRALVVLPAPPQFQNFGNRSATPDNASPNVNFVAVKDGQAVGIQVRSQVTSADRAKYDPTRVILLDARTDMGNQRSTRVKKGSSETRVVNWGGLICIQRSLTAASYGLSLSGNRSAELEHKLILRKMRNRQIVQGVKPYLSIATDRLVERLNAHFDHSA